MLLVLKAQATFELSEAMAENKKNKKIKINKYIYIRNDVHHTSR